MKKKYIQNPDTNKLDVTILQDAADVPYDNSASGLSSTQIQGATDELKTLVDTVQSTVNAATPFAVPSTIVSRDATGASSFKNLRIECSGTVTTNSLSMESSDLGALGGFGLFLKAVSGVQTTSATPSVVIFQGNLPNGFQILVHLSMTVIGRNSNSSKYAILRKDLAVSSDGVNVSLIDISDSYTMRTDPTYDFTLSMSGLTVQVVVTGDATDNMNWLATFEEGVLT